MSGGCSFRAVHLLLCKIGLSKWGDTHRVALRSIPILPLVKASRKGDEEERGAFFRGFFLNLHKQERKLRNRRQRDLADQVFWRGFDSHDQACIMFRRVEIDCFGIVLPSDYGFVLPCDSELSSCCSILRHERGLLVQGSSSFAL